MAPPQRVVKTANAQAKAPDLKQVLNNSIPDVNPSSAGDISSAPAVNPLSQTRVTDVVAVSDGLNKLVIAGEPSSTMSHKKPVSDTAPVVNGSGDNHSSLSNSSTKPGSFDTKSLTSDNTFALDEKESLRPDDSASVQAADEDEPFFSLPASDRSESHQDLDSSNSGLRRPVHAGPITTAQPVRRFPITTIANPPQFGDMVPSPSLGYPSRMTPVESLPATQNGVEPIQQYSTGSIAPDEKLIEALGTPKDRLLLLQLEEKFLAFIAQSKYVVPPHPLCPALELTRLSREATLELPPQNSYERLLSHKLADYYNLGRYTPSDNSSIRLYKAGDAGL